MQYRVSMNGATNNLQATVTNGGAAIYREGYLVQKKRAEHAGYFEYGFRVRATLPYKVGLI
jgi:hypothetical protein